MKFAIVTMFFDYLSKEPFFTSLSLKKYMPCQDLRRGMSLRTAFSASGIPAAAFSAVPIQFKDHGSGLFFPCAGDAFPL